MNVLESQNMQDVHPVTTPQEQPSALKSMKSLKMTNLPIVQEIMTSMVHNTSEGIDEDFTNDPKKDG